MSAARATIGARPTSAIEAGLSWRSNARRAPRFDTIHAVHAADRANHAADRATADARPAAHSASMTVHAAGSTTAAPEVSLWSPSRATLKAKETLPPHPTPATR